VSCPDWRHLDPEAGATRWEDALRHLDAGCQSCRRDALAADPTLVFRRLPVATLTPAAEADEVAAARFAVAAMRTASRNTGRASLEARVPSVSRTVRSLRDRHALHGAKRWALAAGLAAMALLFGSEHGFRGETAALEALRLRLPLVRRGPRRRPRRAFRQQPPPPPWAPHPVPWASRPRTSCRRRRAPPSTGSAGRAPGCIRSMARRCRW
jgi:hypothetical protein